jgi:CRISPR-associated protein Cmr6
VNPMSEKGNILWFDQSCEKGKIESNNKKSFDFSLDCVKSDKDKKTIQNGYCGSVEFEINGNKAVNILITYYRQMLPTDTAEAVKGISADNFGLLFNKYPAFFERNSKFCFFKKGDKKKDGHTNVIINLVSAFNNMGNKYPRVAEKTIEKLLGKDKFQSITFHPDWRLVVGIGNESVYEISMTLHPIYGIPYIPGQAVKGVTRSWVIAEAFGNNEKEALKDELFCNIFGSPKESALGEYQGSVIFFDAFPIGKITLELDIMNPHYGDYYQGKTPPADYLKPNPIPFLTVGKDTEFKFFIGMKKIVDETKILNNVKSSPILKMAVLSQDSWLLKIALTLTKRALSDNGIGAKTAVGYGYMKEKESK